MLELHAVLHDAVGAVEAYSGKSAGYCYMIGRGQNLSLLDQVTGLLFCFYVKLSLLSFFNSVDFWNSMSCIVLDIQLTDKNVFKKLGVLIDGNVQGYSFCPKKLNLQGKQFGVQENSREMCGTVVVWITVSLPIFF